MTVGSVTNGYYTSGDWKGYAYTYGNRGPSNNLLSNVIPANFEGKSNLCVAGANSANDSAGGGFGWNVNQADQPPNPENTWAITGRGINYVVDNTGGSSLRIQVEVGGTQYCAALPSSSGTVLWTELKTQCWEGGNQVALNPAGALLKAIQISSPGFGSHTSTFAFCVKGLSLAPAE